MEYIDRVYIGTGPLCCIDALYNGLRGENVVLLDEKSVFGGAWTTVKHDELPPLEIGCHIWSVDKRTYDFIEELLEIELVRLNPQPVLLKNNYRIPYDWKMNIISIKRIFNNLLKGRIKAIIKDLNNPSFRFSVFPSKYLYPAQGATSFIKKIRNKLENHSINYHLNTKVNKVELHEKEIHLHTKDQVIICGSLVLTSLSAIKCFEFLDGVKIAPVTRKINYIHMHIVIENGFKTSFSYIRLVGDEVIHRISDITFQLEDKKIKGRRVLLIGIYENAHKKYFKDELAVLIIQKLQKHNYLSSEVKIINSYLNVYQSDYNDHELFKEIEQKSEGRIEFMISTDMIYSFSRQLKKWKSLFFANGK